MSKSDSMESLKSVVEAQDKELEAATQEVDKLRVQYEQFFLGIEKREPIAKRNDVARRLRQSNLTRSQSSVTRFRFNALQQRFITYSTYWERIVREIEAGTFKREGFRRFQRGPLTPERVQQGEARADTERLSDKDEDSLARAKETGAEAASFLQSLTKKVSDKLTSRKDKT